MVQRLSLFGTLSPEEKPIAMRSLEALSGMLPKSIEIERQVWEPKMKAERQPTAQNAEQYRLFVVKNRDTLTIEAHEVPEAGRNIKVISQSVLATKVSSEPEEIPAFMSDLGYELKSTHWMRGAQVVLHENVVLHVFQLFNEENELLDKSQENFVHAFADVGSVTDLNGVEQATQLLLGTQQELKGVIALKPPSRNAFNTRIPRAMAA